MASCKGPCPTGGMVLITNGVAYRVWRGLSKGSVRGCAKQGKRHLPCFPVVPEYICQVAKRVVQLHPRGELAGAHDKTRAAAAGAAAAGDGGSQRRQVAPGG